ncbi:MAG: B12-binding domain-containing radical SAM protein, partial [Spirochaetaceae bacterium]|nr:B12-binding domain-containing radical SAM protein [Spirochaetaceae bacterium]
DVYSADIVFIGINTFNAVRGYKIAADIKQKSKAIVVLGGLHASLNYPEAVEYADYVLTGDGDESVIDFINALNNNEQPNFLGIIYKQDGKIINTGARNQPQNIDTIPDRNLVHDYSRLAKKLDTLWVQIHASRGCPHNCDYCTVVRHFGRTIRTRTPENIVADIKIAIEFHKRKIFPRLNTVVWITDDNFAENRAWAVSVLREIIKSGIKANISVQARFETGFDDELLELMKHAGFFELALGIEFLNDSSFKEFHKQSNYDDILRSVKNIQKHGLEVRGLFIVGAENDTKGVGEKIANYVIDNGLDGGLIQSMFFVPGTPVYDTNKDSLIHTNWEKFCGNVVHYPKKIKPHELQEEIIKASAKIYSPKRLLHALFRRSRFINKVLFIGEFFWQASMRADLRKELPYLKSKEQEWYERA